VFILARASHLRWEIGFRALFAPEVWSLNGGRGQGEGMYALGNEIEGLGLHATFPERWKGVEGGVVCFGK
jgi:hypothetical protein